MIDALIRGTSLADLIAQIGARNPDGRGPLYFVGENGSPPGFRGDCTFIVQVWTNGAPDADGNPTQVYLPYVYVWVSLRAIDPFLAALPTCMVVADSDAYERGEPFVLQSAIPQGDWPLYHIEPTRLGSSYPFG